MSVAADKQIYDVTYELTHERSRFGVHGVVVGPLNVVDGRAVGRVIGTIVHIVIRDKADIGSPVVDLVRPFYVCRIASMVCKTSGQKEELAAGDGIPVVVAIVEGENLPLEASITTRGVPAVDLRVENILRELQPASRSRC